MSDMPAGFHGLVEAAFLSGDFDDIVSHFAEEAVVMPPNDSTLYGKPEVRAWWQEYFQYFRITGSVETEREMTVAGDQVFDRHAASITIVPKQQGARIRDDIRSLTVWKRQTNGGWKITHQMWNSTKPVGSGTNRYMTRALQKRPTHRPVSS